MYSVVYECLSDEKRGCCDSYALEKLCYGNVIVSGNGIQNNTPGNDKRDSKMSKRLLSVIKGLLNSKFILSQISLFRLLII